MSSFVYAYNIFMVPKKRQIRRPYYISYASSVQAEKSSKNTFATQTYSQIEKKLELEK